MLRERSTACRGAPDCRRPLVRALLILCGLWWPITSYAVATHSERLALARGYLQRGEIEFARDELEAIPVDQVADSVKAEVTYWLGECYYRLGKYRLAVVHFSDVARMSGRTWRYDALMRAGDSHLALEDPASATASFRDAKRLGRGEKEGDAAYWLAVALSRQGRHEEAARAFALASARGIGEAEQAGYQAARSAAAAGSWALAESLWTAYLRVYPLSERAETGLLSLAHLALQQGHHGSAVAALESLVERFPHSSHTAEALLLLGELELRSGNSTKAVAWLRQLRGSRPPPEFGRRGALALGRALRDAGMERAAVAVLDSLAAAPPADSLTADAYLEGAEILYGQGRFQDSSERLKKAMARGVPPREQVRASRLLGWSLYQAGRWDEARNAFENLVKLAQADPEVAAEASHMAAQSLAKMESLDEAVAALRSSLDTFPGWAAADRSLVLLARLLEAQGRMAEAIDAYLELASRYPSSDNTTEARLRAAQLLVEEGREEEARPLLERLAAEGHGEALYWLAEVHYRSGRPSLAARRFREFLMSSDAADPLRDEAWHGLAWSQVRIERLAAAESTLVRMLDEVTDSPFAGEALLKLGSLRYDDGRAAEAASAFRQLLELYPGSEYADQAVYWLGWSLVLQDSLEDACRVFRGLEESYSGSQLAGRARLATGRCLLSLRRPAEAVVELRAALKGSRSLETDSEAWPALAQAYLDLGSGPGARAAIDSALASGADAGAVAQSMLELGRRWVTAGRDSQAIGLLDSLSSLFPDCSEADEAQYLASIARLRTGETEEAFSGFQLLADSPDPDVRARSLLAAGRVAAEKGLHEQAAGWYRQAAQTASDSVVLRQALFGQAAELHELGQVRSATAVLERLVTSYPGGRDELWEQASLRLAGMLLDEGQTPRAAAVAGELAQHGGEMGMRARLVLGNAYRSLGQHREAARELLAYAAWHPDPGEAHRATYTAGLALMAAEEWTDAATAFGDATADADLAPQALLARGWCLQKAGRDSTAQLAYREILWRAPGTIRAWEAAYRLAELLLAQGRAVEAAATAREALERGAAATEWGDDLLAAVARAMEKAGRPSEAVSWFTRLITEHPSSALVPYAQSRVKALQQAAEEAP
jgi:TolA-binding protein